MLITKNIKELGFNLILVHNEEIISKNLHVHMNISFFLSFFKVVGWF